MSSNLREDPKSILFEAQSAIAQKNWARALDSFTRLLQVVPTAGHPLPLLSRCLCYLELNEVSKAVEDAERVLKLDDVQTPEEIIPGCYSTRVAAAVRLAKAYELLGDASKSNHYKKLGTELLKTSAASTNKALELKEEGNELYRAGKIQEALHKYERALNLNSTDEALLSNACQVLIKLGRLDEAAIMAERCIHAKPSWNKVQIKHHIPETILEAAMYKEHFITPSCLRVIIEKNEGMVAMKQHRYTDAVGAFQEGLRHNPDDAELKKYYMEAAKMAEKATSGEGRFHHKIMGALMDLQHHSWKVNEWFSQGHWRVKWWDRNDWECDCVRQLQDQEVANTIKRSLQTTGTGDSLTVKLQTEPEKMISFIFPDYPLVSLMILHRIFTVAYPTQDWSMAWTFQANPQLFTKSALFPHISAHRTYAVLIARDEHIVVDFLALWASILDGDEKGTSWFDVLAGGGKNGEMAFYTCDDELKMLEFVEGLYSMESTNTLSKRKEDIGRRPTKAPLDASKPEEVADHDSGSSSLTSKSSREPKAQLIAGTSRKLVMIGKELALGVVIVAIMAVMLVLSGTVETDDMRRWLGL